MKHACAKFKVFLLDQRGTGLSDAITTSGLLRKGDAQAQAEYLSYFRCPMYFICLQHSRGLQVTHRILG